MPLGLICYSLNQGVKKSSNWRQCMLRHHRSDFSHIHTIRTALSYITELLISMQLQKTTVDESLACVFSRLESAALVRVGKTIKHEKAWRTVRSRTRMQAKREALILKAK